MFVWLGGSHFTKIWKLFRVAGHLLSLSHHDWGRNVLCVSLGRMLRLHWSAGGSGTICFYSSGISPSKLWSARKYMPSKMQGIWNALNAYVVNCLFMLNNCSEWIDSSFPTGYSKTFCVSFTLVTRELWNADWVLQNWLGTRDFTAHQYSRNANSSYQNYQHPSEQSILPW